MPIDVLKKYVIIVEYQKLLLGGVNMKKIIAGMAVSALLVPGARRGYKRWTNASSAAQYM